MGPAAELANASKLNDKLPQVPSDSSYFLSAVSVNIVHENCNFPGTRCTMDLTEPSFCNPCSSGVCQSGW